MLGSGLAGTMVVKVIVGSGVRCQEVEQSSAVLLQVSGALCLWVYV